MRKKKKWKRKTEKREEEGWLRGGQAAAAS